MKKIIIFFILLTVVNYSQYEDTGTRGKYFSKKTLTESIIPTFGTSKDKLPYPILENNSELIELYWKTWQLAFYHYKNPPKGSPFDSAYIDEAFTRGSWSRPDFVGWSGCGPIELLIENIIGLRTDGTNNSLTWHLTRIDKHGIENLKFGDITVALIVEKEKK
jgi:hypothetical protein